MGRCGAAALAAEQPGHISTGTDRSSGVPLLFSFHDLQPPARVMSCRPWIEAGKTTERTASGHSGVEDRRPGCRCKEPH